MMLILNTDCRQCLQSRAPCAVVYPYPPSRSRPRPWRDDGQHVPVPPITLPNNNNTRCNRCDRTQHPPGAATFASSSNDDGGGSSGGGSAHQVKDTTTMS